MIVLQNPKTQIIYDDMKLVNEFFEMKKVVLKEYKNILLEPNRYKTIFRDNSLHINKNLVVNDENDLITLYIEANKRYIKLELKIKKGKIIEKLLKTNINKEDEFHYKIEC